MFGVIDWFKNYALVLLAVVALAGWATAGVQTYRVSGIQLAQRTDLLKATEEARAKEQEWQLIYKETADAKEASLRALATERDTLLVSLRDRPARLPEAARAACAGTSGRELSGRDAEAFVGLAARADRTRAALDACQKREAALAAP